MKRIEWIDTLKGIGILLMVLGHYPAFDYNGKALILIYSFHMPLFLFLGGYLFSDIRDRRQLFNKLRGNVGSLAVPYFGFSILSLIFYWSDGKPEAANFIYGIFYGLGTENLPNVPLWFFTFYFTGRCIFYMMIYLANVLGKEKRAVREGLLLFFTAALIFASYLYRMKLYKTRLPWNVDMSAICIGFYYIGYQYKHWKQEERLPGFLKWGGCILSFLLWLPVALYGTRVDINASLFGRGILYFYATAVLGIIWCVGLASLLSRFKPLCLILSCLGQNSLYIVGFHIPMNFVAAAVVLPFMPAAIQAAYATKTVTGILFTVIVTILLSLAAGFLWKEAKKNLVTE